MRLGRITVKRALKRMAGWGAAATSPFVARPRMPSACILVYHRVADVGPVDHQVDDWNVPPGVFAAQIASLAEFAELVKLRDLPARLATDSRQAKPLVSLTFDDGYRNFRTQALPVLERYGACATYFVVTSCVGSAKPMAFDRWAQKHHGHAPEDAWRPVDWASLEACLRTGLVCVGSHSHRHLDGRLCDAGQLAEEAEESRQILERRIGADEVFAYAYPYGSSRLGQVSSAYELAVRGAGYGLAVSTDLGLADCTSDRYRLPRVEAHPLDSSAVLRAKVMGALMAYRLTDRLRTANRSASA